MTYAQIKPGCKLHLVFEPGEGWSPERLIPAGCVSKPLCNQGVPATGYRMTINVPLGRSCKKCWLVYDAKINREPKQMIKRKI